MTATVILLIVLILVLVVIAFIALKTKRYDTFAFTVKLIVYAAEQLKKTGVIQDKLSWAMGKAEAWLKRIGIALDLEEIRTLIEGYVGEMNSGKAEKT